MRKTRRSGRDLIALVAFLLLFSWQGLFGRLEAAAVPETQPVPAVEPQLPEQDLLMASRRQMAVTRAQQAAAWSAATVANDLAGAQMEHVRRQEALRRRDQARIADLVPPEYQQMVLDLSAQYGVDPRLVAAVGFVESRWNPNTVGSHNDTGLMQILPSTAAWIAGRLGWSEYDLFDPWTNLTMGIWYLQALHGEYGSWEKALAAYNGGPGHAHLGAGHPYVARVMRAYGEPVVASQSP